MERERQEREREREEREREAKGGMRDKDKLGWNIMGCNGIAMRRRHSKPLFYSQEREMMMVVVREY